MSKHLVIGASGQVGGHIHALLQARAESVDGTSFSHPLEGLPPLNIANADAVRDRFTLSQPAVIWLCAALTNVDYCETDPAEAYAYNVSGVKHVVTWANHIGAKVIYFSSDYIFDGTNGPYAEESPANPICEYGRQKLAAEHYVATQAQSFLIIRTTVVYGHERQGKNFVQRLVQRLKQGEKVSVPNDQIGSPTYAPDLARAVLELAEKDLGGVFNVVGPQRADRYTFACEAARVFGLDSNLIQPVTTPELHQAAARPLNAGMLVDKVTPHLRAPLMSYPEGLRVMAQHPHADK